MKKLEKLAKEAKINQNADIKDQHSIIIDAYIDKVWQLIFKIHEWPTWNPKISQIQMAGEMVEKTKFTWKMSNITFNSEIQLLEKPNLIAWTKKSHWVKGIDLWQMEKDDEQTIVTMGTCFQGLLTPFFIHHKQVYRELLFWLDCLKNTAEK